MTIIINGINGNKFTLIDKRVRFGEFPHDLSLASLTQPLVFVHGATGTSYNAVGGLALCIRETEPRDVFGRFSGRMKIKLRNETKGRNSNDFRAVKFVTDDFGNLVLAEILPQNH